MIRTMTSSLPIPIHSLVPALAHRGLVPTLRGLPGRLGDQTMKELSDHKTIADLGGVDRFKRHFVDMDPSSVDHVDINHIVWMVEEEGEYAQSDSFGDLSDDTVIFDEADSAWEHCHGAFFKEDEGQEDNAYHGLRRGVEVYCYSPIPGVAKSWKEQQFDNHLKRMADLNAKVAA